MPITAFDTAALMFHGVCEKICGKGILRKRCPEKTVAKESCDIVLFRKVPHLCRLDIRAVCQYLSAIMDQGIRASLRPPFQTGSFRCFVTVIDIETVHDAVYRLFCCFYTVRSVLQESAASLLGFADLNGRPCLHYGVDKRGRVQKEENTQASTVERKKRKTRRQARARVKKGKHTGKRERE